jgi:hypothetical protein
MRRSDLTPLAGMPLASPELALIAGDYPRSCAPAGALFAPRDTEIVHGPERACEIPGCESGAYHVHGRRCAPHAFAPTLSGPVCRGCGNRRRISATILHDGAPRPDVCTDCIDREAPACAFCGAHGATDTFEEEGCPRVPCCADEQACCERFHADDAGPRCEFPGCTATRGAEGYCLTHRVWMAHLRG